MVGWKSFLRVDGWSSDFESVDRFLRHYGRKVRSEHTKENACGTLKRFCKFAGMGPDQLVELGSQEASRLVQGFIDGLRDRDLSIRYINVCLAYLKTFFKVNGYEGKKGLEVERYYQPSRYRKREEYIPTPEEIYKMAYASGSTRNKAMILALYTTGFRNSTLRAVLYGDVRQELEKGLDVVKVPCYPEMKKMDSNACKGNIPYYSFLSQEAVEALHRYLEDRREVYGEIKDDEPLFASTSKNLSPEERRYTLVMKKSLANLVKRSAEKAELEKWQAVTPHCLRKAFESALRNNRLDPKDQEFLMGHILPGSQDVYYDHTKVNQLRKKYMQIQFFPQTTTPKQIRKKQVLDTVKLLGFSEDRIKKVEEALAQYETVDDAMDHIRKLSLKSYKRKENSNNDPKKIVCEGDLEDYLQTGWDVQTVLPSGKILIQKAM